VYAPLGKTEGLTPFQLEYKTRRIVNDYCTAQGHPQDGDRPAALRRRSVRTSIRLVAADPHELMRCDGAHTIRDCAELAARASLYRTESRWGLYHLCVDHPEKDDENWFCTPT